METPRYLLHEPLAAGGMGVVHLGTLVSPAGERRVAIKLLAERGRLDGTARERLVAEARLVFQLTHTNICQVLDLGENERGTFVVMEFVAGLDLRRLLSALSRRVAALDSASAVYIAREVARALDYAHRRADGRGLSLGVVHGDVTPQNILLSVEGEVKLADFGIARALAGSAPGAGLRAGTPGYVAPELERGAGDHRVDIYALGITLAVALTGVDAANAPAALERLRSQRSDVTHELVAATQRAVAVDPCQRFLAAGDFERALSLELARSWPAFTPSQLAAIVRAHAKSAPAHPHAQTGVLHSVIATATPTIESAAPRATRTVTRTSPESGSRGWRGAVVVALVLAVIAAVAGAVASSRLKRPAVVPSRATSPAASQKSEPIARGTAAMGADLPIPAATTSSSSARILTPPAKPPARPPRHTHAELPPAASAFLSVNATPWGSIYVDGRRVADETPVYRLALPPGDHTVQVHFGDDPANVRGERVRVVSGEVRTIGLHR